MEAYPLSGFYHIDADLFTEMHLTLCSRNVWLKSLHYVFYVRVFCLEHKLRLIAFILMKRNTLKYCDEGPMSNLICSCRGTSCMFYSHDHDHVMAPSHLAEWPYTYIAVYKHILSGGEITSQAENLCLTWMYLKRTSPNTNAFGAG